ncbi:hypothetical protein [Humisphaera borealis]|uniref:Uncharacterized protein n=1 Tax=Humisphaera borealis TaxID=2807512 RepID=A0A7M2WSK2_9BACT|nr:hypothetical protein [Humisphaera borealis]QOV88162.1 hypothetical protein IPV69_18115 [Humisphaera borealis]
MLYGNVLAIVFSILGFLLSLQGVWLMSSALWPARVAASARKLERSMIASLLAGLALAAVAGIVLRVLIRAGTAGQLAAGLLGLALLIYAGIGMAGLVTLIGHRLSSPADRDRPWKATVRGGVVLGMAYLFPVLGWFGVLPISLIVGAGATTLTFLKRGPTALPPSHSEPVQYNDEPAAAHRELAGASR